MSDEMTAVGEHGSSTTFNDSPLVRSNLAANKKMTSYKSMLRAVFATENNMAKGADDGPRGAVRLGFGQTVSWYHS